MNRERRYVRILIGRKATLLLLAVVVLTGAAGILSSQQLTMTATYPIPAGVYNQIVTTGDSGTAPANTTLNRNRGNTILVPPSNASGNVGIGNSAPTAKLDVAGNAKVSGNASVSGSVTVGGSMGIGRYPASLLSVAGGVQLGNDASSCTAAKAGTMRWNSGSLQVCNGAAWGGVGGGGGGAWSGYGVGVGSYQTTAIAYCPAGFPRAVSASVQCNRTYGSATSLVSYSYVYMAGFASEAWQLWCVQDNSGSSAPVIAVVRVYCVK